MLTIHLDSNLPLPLYEQIYLHIRKDIRSGLLAEQERLPSTRALAAHLSASFYPKAISKHARKAAFMSVPFWN